MFHIFVWNRDAATCSSVYCHGATLAAGGTLTMHTPPATGQTLVIRRDPAIVQELDYVENSAFPAQTHEAALRQLTPQVAAAVTTDETCARTCDVGTQSPNQRVWARVAPGRP